MTFADEEDGWKNFPGTGVLTRFVASDIKPSADDTEGCLLFTRRLACVFYRFRQCGFEHLGLCEPLADVDRCPDYGRPNTGNPEDDLAVLTLWRFCLVCFLDVVPLHCRVACAGCGGIRPTFLLKSYGKECPNAGDLGNHNYRQFIRLLIRKYEELEAAGKITVKPIFMQSGFDQLKQTTSRANAGNVVEAALAAADAALCLQQSQDDGRSSWRRQFVDIVGCGHGRGDEVTEYIDKRAVWVSQYGCECDTCVRVAKKNPNITGPPYLSC